MKYAVEMFQQVFESMQHFESHSGIIYIRWWPKISIYTKDVSEDTCATGAKDIKLNTFKYLKRISGNKMPATCNT
jgi:hypothetical protein